MSTPAKTNGLASGLARRATPFAVVDGRRMRLPSCPYALWLLFRLHYACAMVQETKVSSMKQIAPSPYALRVSELAQNSATPFSLRPDSAQLKAIAAELGVSGLRKLSFEGEVKAVGAADWRLDAKLGATVIQPCVVTLEPVTTRIDVPVERLFLRNYVEVDAPEAEMPEDDTTEALTAWIDPEAIMREALALNLPLYPRAPDAALGEMVVTEPGVAPMRDEDARPFAGLAGLKDQLTDGSKDD
jgi:uncharacterized metal-binding protein YceD (DUF177 family)